MGKTVTVKLWIHFFVGDIEGNNKWLGHYNGGNKVQRPYRDCKCGYNDLDKGHPECEYITKHEVEGAIAEMKAAETIAAKGAISSAISKHCIDNALLHPDLPLSDQIHGPFGMTPPEVLHTTCEGTSKYMIVTLAVVIDEACKKGNKRRMKHAIESVHQQIHHALARNSSRDIPRGTDRSPLLGAKSLTGSEVTGNLFRLLCVLHTQFAVSEVIPVLKAGGIDVQKLRACLTLYLCMEKWFHDTNSQEEVRRASTLVGDVITMIKETFPRKTGNGWHLPKVHGLTKFTHHMCRYGSAINFFGGIGEHNHVSFVKKTGRNTQKRIGSFVSQLSLRYYETHILGLAQSFSNARMTRQGYTFVQATKKSSWDDKYRGKFSITVTSRDQNRLFQYTTKSSNKKRRQTASLENEFLKIVVTRGHFSGKHLPLTFTSFSSVVKWIDGEQYIFRCCDEFYGKGAWYDWLLVDLYEEGQYPAQLLGAFAFDDTDIESCHVVVRLATSPMSWEEIETDFVRGLVLGTEDEDVRLIDYDQIMSSLVVYPNYGAVSEEFLCALPCYKWADFFRRSIK